MVAFGFANAKPVETGEKHDIRLLWVPFQKNPVTRVYPRIVLGPDRLGRKKISALYPLAVSTWVK